MSSTVYYGTPSVVLGDDASYLNSSTISGKDTGIYFEDGNTIQNDGIISGSLHGLYSDGNGNTITNTGKISGDLFFGIFVAGSNTVVNSGSISGGFGGVYSIFSSVDVVNAGSIESTYGAGVQVEGPDSSVVNTGTIYGLDVGVMAITGSQVLNLGKISGDRGVIMGDGNTLVNAGSISGITEPGLQMQTANVVINSGTIEAERSYGIFAYDGNTIVNSGSVAGGGRDGMRMWSSNAIENSGTVEGAEWGIHALARNAVVNSGLILGGNVGLEVTSDNVIVNSGTMSGGEQGLVIGDGNVVTNTGTISAITAVVTGAALAGDLSAAAASAGSDAAILVTGTGNVINNTGRITASGTAVDIEGTGNTLNILEGSIIQGLLSIAAGNDLHVDAGRDAVLSYTGAPTVSVGSGYVFDTGSAIIVMDMSGFTSEDERLNVLTRAIADAAEGRLSTTRGADALHVRADGDLVIPVADAPEAPGGAVWAATFGDLRRQPDDGTAGGYDTRLGGLMLGGDGAVADGVRAGVLAGTAVSRFEARSGSHVIDADNYFASVYAGVDRGDIFLDAVLTGGLSRQSGDRTVLNNTVPGGIEQATADHDAVFVSPSLALGTNLALADGILTPSLRVRYAAMFLEGYEENGSTANMTVERRQVNLADFRGQLAFAAAPWATSGGSLGLELRAGGDLTGTFGDEVEAEILATPLDFDAEDSGLSFRVFLGLAASFAIPDAACFSLSSELGVNGSAAIDANLTASFQMPL
ncbi:MAG: autotransporter domain-containing protein [Hyphomicrobiales bacterium]